jgi:CBS domain-containing protein
MQAQDVMARGVIAIGPDMPVQFAARAMISNKVSALVVMGIDARLMGIISEGDLLRRVETGTEQTHSAWPEMFVSSDTLTKQFIKSRGKRARDVMTRDVVTAAPETPLREIADLMEKHGVKRVPILKDDIVVGIVSRADFLRVLASVSETADWVESDRAMHERFVESIEGQPWANRPFNVAINERRAELWGYVYSEAEKTAVRVAVEAIPGIETVEDHLRVMPPTADGWQ